jgi:multidrug resistance efflux pump
MFTNMSSTYTESNLIASLQDLKLRLQQLTPTLDKIEVMLQYTTATSSLPQTQIDGYKATVDAYQLQVQTKSSAITEQINLMQSFFSSYKDNQSSALKQKELIEQQARVTESTLGDSEEIALLQVQRAEATYNQALTNKQKNIPSLKNTIDQAQIALSEAYDQLNKFEVLTPIDGTVGQVLVDVGQEVSAGTPLVTIKSTNSQQVEIALTQEELAFVTVGQEVSVTN